MSLPIEVGGIVGVLLRDGWHNVSDKTFKLAKFEGVSSIGARWKEPSGQWTECQLPNIIAVRFE